jgi:hypothetical protein
VTSIGGVLGAVVQLFVAMYGGYFGAGLGLTLGAIINLVSFVFLAFEGLVIWPLAVVMSAGVIVGGYAGARLAMRIDSRLVHVVAVAIGVLVSIWFFVKS